MGNHTQPSRTGAHARRAAVRRESRAFVAGAARNFIPRSQVAAWTRENAPNIPAIAAHYGTPEHIARLKRDGVDVSRNLMGVFGSGFYAFNPAGVRHGSDLERYALSRYGPARVAVALRVQHPYAVPLSTFLKFTEQLGRAHPGVRPYTQPFYRLITDTLRRQGYDGAAVWEDDLGPHAAHIVSFVQGNARIVR